ncbi:MAG: carbohydrate ABC transporter permease [Lachnospiraceae bacterium]|nr:carbohydrate ABC transporter permease [Lachnospiraceae bacterium]
MVMKNRSIADKIGYAFIIVFLIIMAALCAYPLLNTIAISLSDKSAVAAGRVTIFPVDFTLKAYGVILQDAKFFRATMISVVRVILGGSLSFVLTILMAYPLSKTKKEFRLRNVFMWTVVFTTLFSGGLIPWYMTIAKLNILNTIWALVLPSAVPAGNVIMLMNFFRNLPKELNEAAVMDGASEWSVMWKIYIPLSLPALATVTLFSLVGIWNDFFNGLILMNSDNYPLQTYIQQLVVSVNDLRLYTPEEMLLLTEVSNSTLNMAKIVVSMLPILILYPFLQRFFMTGLVLGAVKE